MAIQPLSTTRVTDATTRRRLTAQIQSDQRDLLRLQTQLSTGLRISLPSDDPASAQRAIVLQRTLERKDQSQTNVRGAEAALSTSWEALGQVGDRISELKSQALAVVDTIADDEQRQAVIEQVDGLLFELQRVANTTLTTNYLFGGAERTAAAYRSFGPYVEYLGDESSPQTFVDIGQLFDTGVSGNDVFGGLSEAVRGSADLNAGLTLDTPLARLNGGRGVDVRGAVELRFVPSSPSGATTSTVVDLSSAKTIEDVARLLEAGSPAGTSVVVSVQGNALRIDATSGGLTISEVASGETARQLGILNPSSASASIVGSDLDPTISPATRLSDLVGSKARGRVTSPGADNDLTITAAANGAAFNGVTVDYVDGATVGNESAVYNSGTNTLTVTIASGQSTAAQAAAAISAEGTFAAEPDTRDQSSPASRGAGVVTAGGATAVGVAGGVNGSLDLASGLRVTNGTDVYTIDTSAAETVEDLLGVLNDPDYGLAASISASGDAIDVRSRRSGAAFSIGENGGTTATQLGIRSYTTSSRLADFNRGVGVVIAGESDAATRSQNRLEFSVRNQGVTTTYDVDPVGLTTVQDLFDRISAATSGAVTASLATSGNGIVLTRADAIDAAAPATGTASLAGDSLTITADAAGAAGNAAFTLEVIDGGSGGLAVAVNGSAIVVDLGGAPSTTGALAAAVGAALPAHAVTSSGSAAVSAPVAAQPLVAAGGYDADGFTLSGNVAERLGFVAADEESVTSSGPTLASDDRNPLEVDSVFTSLIRIREALESGDSLALGNELVRLDEDFDRVALGRAEVGVRLKNLETVALRLDDEEVALRAALSEEIDADLVEVISDYTAKQYALQASLQTAGSLLNLSILDFI